MPEYRVAVMVGSVRPASINRKLARAIAKLAPAGLQFHDLRIDDLPFFDQDREQAPPEPVLRLKSEVRAADAVLFVTPEYNRSVPGLLKNAFDWGSRPSGQSVWNGKPCAVAGASPGKLGTAAAQAHLRSVLLVQGMAVLGQPEFYFQFAAGLIDADDKADEATSKFIGNFLQRFSAWIDIHARRNAG